MGGMDLPPIAWKLLPSAAILALVAFIGLLVFLQRFGPRVQNILRLLLLLLFAAIWIALVLSALLLVRGVR